MPKWHSIGKSLDSDEELGLFALQTCLLSCLAKGHPVPSASTLETTNSRCIDPVLRKLFLQSELFVTVVCFGSSMIIKLISSIILTRILAPEAYGIMILLMSIATFFELISDLGMLTVMLRHERGDDQAFINTMWTIRLIRNCVNCFLLVTLAPIIAKIFATPELKAVIRVYAIVLIIHACESMSFMLAARHRKNRIVAYINLFATAVTTPAIIFCSLIYRDYHGMLYGIILQTLITTVASHFFYRDRRPRIQLEPAASRDLFAFSKFVIPSSIIAMLLSQFDKFIFLKLFDLRLFGIYGIAGGLASPATGLGDQLSRAVLFPRCAEYARSNPKTAHLNFYHNNSLIFIAILAFPPIVAGAADVIVQLLYDERYAYASVIVRAFLARGVLNTLAVTTEHLLLALGFSHITLVACVLRLCWLIPGCLLGFYYFGFPGFLYAAMLEPLPQLIYLWHLQFKEGMLIVKYECLKLTFVASLFIISYAISSQISGVALRAFIKSFF